MKKKEIYKYNCVDCPIRKAYLGDLLVKNLKVIKGIEEESRFWNDIESVHELPPDIISKLAEMHFKFHNRRSIISDYIEKKIPPEHVENAEILSLFFGLLIRDGLKYGNEFPDFENDLTIVINDEGIVNDLKEIFKKELPLTKKEMESMEPTVVSPSCDFNWRIVKVVHDIRKDSRNTIKVQLRFALHKDGGIHQEVVFELTPESFKEVYEAFKKINTKLKSDVL